MVKILETSRLYIKPLSMADEQGMFAMDSDPIVHRYLGNKPYTTIEQTRENIAFILQQYKDFNIGRWAILEKGSNEFVGWTGFKFIPGPINGHTNYYDFGYRLMRKFWGKGYATESGIASFNYGIDTLGFKSIYAMTDIHNKASRHILEKFGFQYIEDFAYDARPDWREKGQLTTWYKWIPQTQ